MKVKTDDRSGDIVSEEELEWHYFSRIRFLRNGWIENIDSFPGWRQRIFQESSPLQKVGYMGNYNPHILFSKPPLTHGMVIVWYEKE